MYCFSINLTIYFINKRKNTPATAVVKGYCIVSAVRAFSCVMLSTVIRHPYFSWWSATQWLPNTCPNKIIPLIGGDMYNWDAGACAFLLCQTVYRDINHASGCFYTRAPLATAIWINLRFHNGILNIHDSMAAMTELRWCAIDRPMSGKQWFLTGRFSALTALSWWGH